MPLMLLGNVPCVARGGAPITLKESGTDELPERDWLFPAILATLLAGSAISFSLAYASGHIVQHQELRLTSDHSSAHVTGAEPTVLRTHGPSGE